MSDVVVMVSEGRDIPVIVDGSPGVPGLAGAPGPAGDIPGYATRAALIAVAGVANATAYLKEAGREGMFVFSTANLSTLVTADTRQALYIAPSSDTTGASGAWVRKFDGWLNVMWFGAAADNVTDDLPAFNAALALIRARLLGAFKGANRLYVPAGRYHLSDTLNIHTPVYLQGAGSAQADANGLGSLLRFSANTNGVVFNYEGATYTTVGDTTGAVGLGSSTGSTMEGFQLWGRAVTVNGSGTPTSFANGTATTGHGVRIRAPFIALKDVQCSFFGGSGFNINATSGGAAIVQGNANSFRLERCQAVYNRGYGYEINGADANAGTMDNCSAIENGGCGFVDYSFLGNTYIQPHSAHNGHTDPTGSSGPVGMANFGGTNYYVKASQLAAASTTQPGTDPNVWVATTASAPRLWVTGQTWVLPGAYVTNPSNGNGCNTFINAYAEGGQAPIQGYSNTFYVGGLLYEVNFDADCRAVHVRPALVSSNQEGLVVPGLLSTSSVSGQVATDPIHVASYRAAWDATTPGLVAGSFHLNPATNAPPANSGCALTFGGRDFGAGGEQAMAGIYTRTDGAYGTRMYLATTDSAAAGSKSAVEILESGDVGIVRGGLSVGGRAIAAASPVATQSGTSYTAVLADAAKYIRFTNASPVTFTIPPNASVAFPIGTEIDGIQAGAGALTIAPGAGVTLNSSGADLVLAGQYSAFTAKKVGTNEWDVMGKF